MPIDDFFPHEDLPGHPLLRLVAARLRVGQKPVFELSRPRESLGFRKAEIIIHFFDGDQKVDDVHDEWDDDLNTGLIHLGVKSETADEEKDRFALGLRAAFRRPERRYGDGYFSAVLVQFVVNSEFRDHPELGSLLRHLPPARPNPGRSMEDCREMIKAAIIGRAVELTEKLGYSRPDAWNILAGAMARYMDERFSITTRRLLNLL